MSEWPRRARDDVRRWWRSLRDLTSDALLYALAALFALGTGLTSSATAQWHWGYLAMVPYALAALAAGAMSRAKWTPDRVTRARVALVIFVILGTVVVPLATLVHWRDAHPTQGFAQPEVMVVERAAEHVVHAQSPYTSYWSDAHLVHPVSGVAPYESFFPYFPLMSVYGLPAVALGPTSPWGDAREAMTLVTMVLGGVSLALMRATRRQKIRVAQFLVALPTGALFLATGGDDMPILALSLLGVVALQRRTTWLAGVALGVAAASKLTAWPLALGAVLVARDGRRGAGVRVAAWVGAVGIVTVLPYLVASPTAFVANVVAFPLGLAHVASPAASPLPGHLLTGVWAPAGHILTPLTLLVSGYLASRYARTRWPLSLSQLLLILSVVSTALICVASATRIGYVIYPVNFALWSLVVAEVAEPARPQIPVG